MCYISLLEIELMLALLVVLNLTPSVHGIYVMLLSVTPAARICWG